MTRGIKTIALIILIATSQFVAGQTKEEIALDKGKRAVILMDNGKFDESIKLLEEAHELDPDFFDYPYEIAYAHYLQEDYKGAIKYMEKYTNHKNVTDQLYQLLGNSYDILGKTEKAFEAYDAGLKIFPNSGILYLEKGNVYWNQKEYMLALPFYETGIEKDPAFPSNYYRATLIYCNSTEEVWGMIYGEIFMNLDRNSKRTAEISKLLYDTYKSQIKFTSDTTMSVSFSGNVLNLDDFGGGLNNFKLPFGLMTYEPTMLMAIVNEKSIDINSLDRIRKNFVDVYFQNGNATKYPNILFDYQKEMVELGHLEAYNHWILMQGDLNGFNEWQIDNKEKYDNFILWFTDNGLKVDKDHKFYRGQY